MYCSDRCLLSDATDRNRDRCKALWASSNAVVVSNTPDQQPEEGILQERMSPAVETQCVSKSASDSSGTVRSRTWPTECGVLCRGNGASPPYLSIAMPSSSCRRALSARGLGFFSCLL